MPIVRPDIDIWVRDRAPKFVSRATFKNLNRWDRVFDADRRESIAFWLQYCLGLRLFLLLWATEVVCCPLGLSVVAKEPCTKVAIEEEGARKCVWSSVVLA